MIKASWQCKKNKKLNVIYDSSNYNLDRSKDSNLVVTIVVGSRLFTLQASNAVTIRNTFKLVLIIHFE